MERHETLIWTQLTLEHRSGVISGFKCKWDLLFSSTHYRRACLNFKLNKQRYVWSLGRYNWNRSWQISFTEALKYESFIFFSAFLRLKSCNPISQGWLLLSFSKQNKLKFLKISNWSLSEKRFASNFDFKAQTFWRFESRPYFYKYNWMFGSKLFRKTSAC